MKAIGLLMLRRAGVEDVLLVGGRSQRLALARELGAKQVLNYHEASGDLAAAVRRAGVIKVVLEW
jgi:NADPH:quinone reductase-like Zn-dependent oxidoreductase